MLTQPNNFQELCLGYTQIYSKKMLIALIKHTIHLQGLENP